MSDKRISIVVQVTEVHLKKNLISLILGRDGFTQRTSDGKTETYSNEVYKVTVTPNMNEASEDIKKRDPAMCLLVVGDGFSPEQVWHQIEQLHEITGKSTEDFIVVPPLGYKHESYKFMFYTWDDLFKTLRKLAKDMLTNKRSEQTHTQTSGAAFRYPTGSSTDNKKSLKEHHSVTKVNLVLLGMSGTGKSASGNTILGGPQFVSKASSKPITTECQSAETERNGTCVRVIDTPDMFDDEIKPSDKKQHVAQCKQLCQSDPCVYLLVMHVSRFTDGERDILRKFEEAFGPRAKEQTIILFTRGDDLQSSDMSLKDFLQDCQPDLKNIVKQCDRRCIVFENKNSRQHQVTELMQTVNEMLNK